MRRTAPSGVRRVSPIAAALATEIGEVRNENQDRIVCARGRDKLGRPFAIIALADGIGGMRQGAECAALTLGSLLSDVAEAAQSSINASKWLLRGIHQANKDVRAMIYGEGGSTLATVLLAGDGTCYWASVGDSRVYQINGSKLTQLSTDDTIAGQLGRGADVGIEQSKLIQFIGIGKPLEISVSELDISTSKTVFLTTDGVHYLDSTPWFGQLIKHAPDPGICVRRMVELSKWCGGPDNASAAVVTLGGVLDEGLPRLDGCLEVWDPFGELQVIVETSLGSILPTPVGAKDDMPVTFQPMVAKMSSTTGIERDGIAPTPQKRSRPPRKSKAATDKAQQVEKSKNKLDVPQLLIEFPNKTG